jgi:cytochrome c-type biogenesis protein
VPFLLVGLGVQRFMGAWGWVRRHYEAITAVSGALLVTVGVLLLTGQFTRLFAPLARYAPGL